MANQEKRPNPDSRDSLESDASKPSQMLKQAQREAINFAAISTMGLELAGIILLMTFGGWWIDGKVGSSPWFLLLGMFIGVTGGLYRMFKAASKFMEK